MTKKTIIIALLFIFFAMNISAYESFDSDYILNYSIPDEPLCSESFEVCVTLTSLVFSPMKFSCNAGSTQINKTINVEANETYCFFISNTTIGAYDGLGVECSIFSQDDGEILIGEFDTSYSCPVPVCGNSEVEVGEACDDGELNGEVCSAEYGSSCNYCSNTCEEEVVYGEFCGDNICQSNEDYLSCSNDCIKPLVCGDSFLDSNEECDDGNLINGDSCSSTCEDEEPTSKKRKSYSAWFEPECNANWECSTWSECDGDVKHRSCNDYNLCYSTIDKPIETIGCNIILPSTLEPETNNNLRILIGSFIILFVILISLLIYSRD